MLHYCVPDRFMTYLNHDTSVRVGRVAIDEGCKIKGDEARPVVAGVSVRGVLVLLYIEDETLVARVGVVCVFFWASLTASTRVLSSREEIAKSWRASFLCCWFDITRG